MCDHEIRKEIKEQTVKQKTKRGQQGADNERNGKAMPEYERCESIAKRASDYRWTCQGHHDYMLLWCGKPSTDP